MPGSSPRSASAPSRPRYQVNQSPISSRMRVPGCPPSWPPANQATFTGVPVAAIWRALASAWSRPNRVSCSPCTSRVGAVIRSVTLAGEERRSSSAVAGESRPVVADSVYPAQIAGTNRPQVAARRAWPGRRRGRAGSRRPAAGARADGQPPPTCRPGVGPPTAAGPSPAEKKIPAQPDLNTPSGANAPWAGVSTGSGAVDGGVREQGLPQVVPGDHRGQRVHPAVVPGQQQREGAAVGAAGDAHPRIAGPVQNHLGSRGQPVDQRSRVGHLVVG